MINKYHFWQLNDEVRQKVRENLLTRYADDKKLKKLVGDNNKDYYDILSALVDTWILFQSKRSKKTEKMWLKKSKNSSLQIRLKFI